MHVGFSRAVKGGFFLMKKPHHCVLSVYSNSENAVADELLREPVTARMGYLTTAIERRYTLAAIFLRVGERAFYARARLIVRRISLVCTIDCANQQSAHQLLEATMNLLTSNQWPDTKKATCRWFVYLLLCIVACGALCPRTVPCLDSRNSRGSNWRGDSGRAADSVG